MAGRPTKLTKALITKAREYLEETGSFVPNALLPTVEGLSLRLDINRDTVYAWCEPVDVEPGETYDALELSKELELRAQFSDIVGKLKSLQAEKLIQKSLAGHYNASIAKLILSGKHGYVEQTKQDLTTNGKDLPVPILGGATKGAE